MACYEGLSLVDNSTYVSTLTVYNGAMEPLSTTVTSSGGKMAIHSDKPAVSRSLSSERLSIFVAFELWMAIVICRSAIAIVDGHSNVVILGGH